MDYDVCTSLPAMFFDNTAEIGDRGFLWERRDGAWHPVSGADARRQAAALSAALAELGVAKGDRIALVSENRPEWMIADIGIMAAGAIAVPAYVTNQVSDHLHILKDSGAKGAIVSGPALAKNLLPAAREAGLEFIISMAPLDGAPLDGAPLDGAPLDGAPLDGAPLDGAPLDGDGNGDSPAIHLWSDLLAAQDGATPDISAIARTDTACLIYTSGTGGTPKGVMLSHGAILSNCKGAFHLLLDFGLDDEVFLSFLPLSHSYEHTAGLMFPLSINAEIYYAESIDKLAANMEEVKPTIMTAVPRLYETMYGRIVRGVQQKGGLSEKLFMKAVATGRKKYEGERLSLGEALLDPLLTKLVRKKVAGRFGGRLKAMVSGGAPLNYEVGVFFKALDVELLQGYGQTESAPIISCNPPSNNKMRTVGPPFVDIDLKIAGDGEILVRGELVMQGYWNNAEATAEAISDGWLHTGDIGEVDNHGHLMITDRKKDIIVNSGGDNIAPQRIEGFLDLQPEIAQSMVYGDKKPNIVALIVPHPDFAADWAKANGKKMDMAALVEDADFRKAIADAVDKVNTDMSVIERVRKFILTAEAFTTENEMMTPSMKIRRHVIRQNYGDALEALYAR